MSQSLATKYRPSSFDDLCEQSEIRAILNNQLKNRDIRNAYLFTGPAGCGKTTSARIFANEINQGLGSPVELDAASNNSVDDVREIIQDAKTQSLDSEYKIYILDEVHSLSNNAWQAMLKLLEEPPAKSVFILCTTDPQKIPKTILSRVQRFDFQRISQKGIMLRLHYILGSELAQNKELKWDDYTLEYIARLADGGMRDAITMLDKCLAYSEKLTVENVVKALGVANYDVMFSLTRALTNRDADAVLGIVNEIYAQGKDLKTFSKTYMTFILDLCKFDVTRTYDYVQIPASYDLESNPQDMFEYCHRLLDLLVKLNERLRWEPSPKSVIESMLLLECFRED